MRGGKVVMLGQSVCRLSRYYCGLQSDKLSATCRFFARIKPNELSTFTDALDLNTNFGLDLSLT